MIPGSVVRQDSGPHGTPGKLALENGFSSDALELGWHDNERGKSCIKADVYRGRVWYSPTLKRPVVRLEDKNGRHDCLLHNGNWAGDVDQGDVTQVHGCTEVGHGYGEIQRPDGVKQWGILHSGATLAGLIESLEIPGAEHVVDAEGFISGYEDVLIAYSWAPGCAPEGDA